MDKPHAVAIPAITLLKLGGQTLFQVARAFARNYPSWTHRIP